MVMGVDRMQGEELNFGSVAAAVLKSSKASVLVISTGDGRRSESPS
ncbi:MAG: hypothetical protein ACJ8EE_01685 [Bradyrhizobium sp.]